MCSPQCAPGTHTRCRCSHFEDQKLQLPEHMQVSDIAIAVREGTDAIMLSGESAYGKFPYKSVDVMATVAKHTEQSMLSYAVCTEFRTATCSCLHCVQKGSGSTPSCPTLSGCATLGLSLSRYLHAFACRRDLKGCGSQHPCT